MKLVVSLCEYTCALLCDLYVCKIDNFEKNSYDLFSILLKTLNILLGSEQSIYVNIHTVYCLRYTTLFVAFIKMTFFRKHFSCDYICLEHSLLLLRTQLIIAQNTQS